MENKNSFTILVVVVALVAAGYFIGRSAGYKAAVADGKKVQQAIAAKAAAEAAKASNPFAPTNPAEGIKANPFAEAKEAINPFQ